MNIFANKIFNKKCGFTLAEVLITLVVIGVIAAMTIPTVINNTKKQEYVSKLKKAYSTLAQTTSRAIVDNGPITTWSVDNTIFAEKYLLPYLSISKNCKFDVASDDCKYSYQLLNLSPRNVGYHFYLNDGSMIAPTAVSASTADYADILIDVNGNKQPNTMGKDVFHFRYIMKYPGNESQEGKFFPPDFELSRYQAKNHAIYGCNKEAFGNYCSNVIMLDSWQIKDDYPW